MVFSTVVVCLLVGGSLADEAPSAVPPQTLDDAKLREALRPLLKIASKADRSAPEQIASQIQALASKTGNDPRLHYLHGLVLLKNFRHAEAMQAMQAGADHKLYYFPIHHVLIYEQIRQKQYEAAIDSLLDLATRIGDPGQLWTSEVERLEAAQWMGRMMVYLSGPCGDSSAQMLASQADPVIRSLLPPVYQIEMDGGGNELHAEHRALQFQLLATVEGSTAKKASLLKEAEQKQDALNNQKKEVTTSAREQAAVQQEQLKEVESKLQGLEKQYIQLQRTHDQIVTAIASLRVQIATLPVTGTTNTGTLANTNAIQRFMNLSQATSAQQIAMRELELQGYIIELNQNLQKQGEVVKLAEARLGERQQLLAQLQIEDKRRQDATDSLRRWQRRLALSQKKVAAEGDRTSATVRSRISQLSTYDAINANAELGQWEQLLESD